ncbi:hypothetical protein [Sphingomonas sp. TDK1]|uniref:hypothetical protein n=1 Tax=Sphingomonas sp. TDK1 TaxID=453247 RepID=UPI0007D8D8D3|nr:hypothetical protein [Sphingomonas sp. TDK1]OAN66363.1 hypothetical protein A7X12_13395 [Sphingomonas sp. TDK1]
MFRLRRHLRTHCWLAFAILAAALLARVCVPAGFMPVRDTDGTVRLAFCSGYGPAPMAASMPASPADGMPHAMGGMHHMAGMTHAMPSHDRPADGAQMQSPCAFADLALAAIGGADPIQLAALLLFVLATGFITALPLPPRAPARLRPPLRAPPSLA